VLFLALLHPSPISAGGDGRFVRYRHRHRRARRALHLGREKLRRTPFRWTALISSPACCCCLPLNGPIRPERRLSSARTWSSTFPSHARGAAAAARWVPGWMLRPILSRPGIAPVADFHAISTVVFNLMIAVWHLPQFACRRWRILILHIVRHLMFMAARDVVALWAGFRIPSRLKYPGD